MSRGLLGKKLGMTGVFSPDGRHIPVTVVQAGPCVVTQIKTKAKDGYDALQLGFDDKKRSRVNRALQGHLKKSGDRCFRFLMEFAVGNPEKYSMGQELTVEMFNVGDHVDVMGTSKGRGFAGTIKRHGFHRGPMTHGCNNIRQPGSIGSSAWPSRVIKGKKLPGHFGNERKTIRNIEIIDIRSNDNMILLKGAIPGTASGLVAIYKPKFKFKTDQADS